MKSETEISSNRMVILTISLLSIFILIRTAWLGDDAFITMRTVDNWVNGYGLTWNVGVRVVTYTHPLWGLLLSVLYYFIRDGYFTLLTLNIGVSFAVFCIYLKQFSGDLFSMLFGWGILVLSKAFVDYSTSGLENGLTHLLILLFAIIFLNPNHPITPRKFLILALLAGLGATNRMDAILFFIPALGYLWFTNFRTLRGFGIMMVGLAPFILWELFSILYYGFPFPNTAYAKLNSGIAQHALTSQGILYFINSLTFDPITLLTIGISLMVIFLRNNSREKALGAGLVLYLGYILYIGGDFMSGRFFSAGLLLSAFILAGNIKAISNSHKLVICGLVLITGFLSPVSTINYFQTNPNIPSTPEGYTVDPYSQIADERMYYSLYTNLSAMDRSLMMPRHEWASSGVEYKLENTPVVVEASVGMIGYFAGPKVHLLDQYAIGDPLLARLKVTSGNWRIGHFVRDIPAGYVDTLKIDKNRIKDPNLAEYYGKLKIIISGNLFSMERLKTIWEMNTGQYDYLLEGYNH